MPVEARCQANRGINAVGFSKLTKYCDSFRFLKLFVSIFAGRAHSCLFNQRCTLLILSITLVVYMTFLTSAENLNIGEMTSRFSSLLSIVSGYISCRFSVTTVPCVKHGCRRLIPTADIFPLLFRRMRFAPSCNILNIGKLIPSRQQHRTLMIYGYLNLNCSQSFFAIIKIYS